MCSCCSWVGRIPIKATVKYHIEYNWTKQKCIRQHLGYKNRKKNTPTFPTSLYLVNIEPIITIVSRMDGLDCNSKRLCCTSCASKKPERCTVAAWNTSSNKGLQWSKLLQVCRESFVVQWCVRICWK